MRRSARRLRTRAATCPVSQTNHGQAALAGLKVRTRLIKSGTTNWRLFGQMLGGPQWS